MLYHPFAYREKTEVRMDEKSKPLGVFDSGVGGLTALRRLREICPNEDIIYFGDTGRVPYGTKSAQLIRKYALQDARFLESFGVKAILVACGTVSANAMDELKNGSKVHVMGVISPAVEKAVKLTKTNGKVLILGTEATIESHAYGRLLCDIRPDIKVLTKACPMFVPLAENGLTSYSHPAVKALVEEYLWEFRDEAPDCVILGCTHYPLLAGAVSEVLPESALIDTGRAAAEEMKEYLISQGLDNCGGGNISVYVSDRVRNFGRLAADFLCEDIGEAQKVDIEKY